MGKLVTLNDIDGDKFLSKLKDKEVIVFEDIQGSKIWVNWNGENWTIRPKSINSEPLSMIDLAMQKFYNKAYLHFLSLPDNVCELLNKRWSFCFEYFPDEMPANVKYDKVPQNNLILTCIYKGNKRYTCDVDEIVEYANLLDTDKLPIIYRGVLSHKQLSLLNHFIHTSKKDLEYVFGDNSFAEFFYKILNPQYKNSFLMNSGKFQENMERIFIRVLDSNEDTSFEVLNPLYNKTSEGFDTDFVDVYTLILSNFMQFTQSLLWDTIPVKGNTYDLCYIDLMSRLYNLYMERMAKDLMGFQFTIPPFFNQNKFKINKELISNLDTLNWVNQSEKLEYVFKILLSSFQKPKKKPVGIFTEQTIVAFNKLVQKISDKIRDTLKYAVELDNYTKHTLNFDEFSAIKWDADADGKIYPNFDFDDNNTSDDAKKKKMIKTMDGLKK